MVIQYDKNTGKITFSPDQKEPEKTKSNPMSEAPRQEPPQNGDSITIPTPWGNPLIARGSMVILIILIIAGGYLSYLWNIERKHEHDELQNAINYQACLQKLNLYVVTAREPTALNLRSLPNELWSCLPRFLSEEQQQQRKNTDTQH